jgi:membrane fusion protein, multidrug efflux system
VTGNIIAVDVTDDQIVKIGDLLAKIDPRDYQATVNQADAQIRQAEATIKSIEAQVSAQQAQIDQTSQQVTEADAALKFAEEENTRYQDLAKTGAGTIQRAQQSSSDLKSRRAALDAALAANAAAQRQIEVLQASKQVSAAQRDQYAAQKARAEADLGRTELRATVDGRIAKLTAAVGNLATSAQSIMVVVPLDVWVTANFKETQLANMPLGQPADISIDAYGRSFPGHVVGIQAGSGTAFSLLPAENATGNFVKVVQRAQSEHWRRETVFFPASSRLVDAAHGRDTPQSSRWSQSLQHDLREGQSPICVPRPLELPEGAGRCRSLGRPFVQCGCASLAMISAHSRAQRVWC